MASEFARSGILFRFIMRKERFRSLLWLVGVPCFTFIITFALDDLYPTQQARDGMAEGMRNPAMTAMVGPGDLDHYTLGAMTAHQMLLFTAIIVGLMNILLVTRHTRGDEEKGRMEIIQSLPVGRLSNLHAMLLMVCVSNLLLALVTGFGLATLPFDGMGLEGSLLYGAVLGGIGLFFAGVAALFAQLSGSNRGARGYAITLLVIAYLMRGIGDVTVEALSWISPLGWVTKAQVYAHNDWWPVCLMFLGSAIGFAGAYYLHSIRDLGAGFLNERPGRKQASPLLRTPIGLAWRLQRTGTIAWGIGMLLIGLSYGSVLGELESFFQENEMMKQFLAEAPGVSLTEQFISKIITVMAILATVPPVMAMNKLYGEEKRNRIEPVLGRAVSRTRLMTSYGLLSAGNGFVMLSLAAIGLWAAGTAAMEGKLAFGMVYSAAIAFYPALLVMIGTSAMLIGLLPKWNALVWLYLFYSFIVVYLGGLFQFPEWVAQISPFGHIPQLPVEEMDVSKVWLLTAVAILLATVGWMGYKRRDLHG